MLGFTYHWKSTAIKKNKRSVVCRSARVRDRFVVKSCKLIDIFTNKKYSESKEKIQNKQINKNNGFYHKQNQVGESTKMTFVIFLYNKYDIVCLNDLFTFLY